MSDVPELIEPIKVHIKQINKATTTYSSGVTGRREIQNYVARNSTIILDAQVVFGNTTQKSYYSQLGVDEQIKGYLVLRYKDLDDVSINLQRGDKIIKLGQLDTELFLLHGKGDSTAQFTSIGGFTLVRMFFADKEPIM